MNALSNLVKEDLNDRKTDMCEMLKAEIDQLVLERNKLASENVNLKEEIGHFHKMKSFEVMQKLLYIS